MTTLFRRMEVSQRGASIPHGCEAQGRPPEADANVRQRQEQAADMARLCGADTESAEDTVQRMRCLPGSEQQITRVLFGGGVLLLAGLGLMALLAWAAR